MEFKYLPGLILIAGACLVLMIRYGDKPSMPNRLQVFGINESGSFLNVDYFKENVWDTNQDQFENSLINLIVFLDPITECPANIHEAEIWSEFTHRMDRSKYNLTIFMPHNTPPEAVEAFKETFVLDSGNFSYYKYNERLALYSQQGLFKVCWSLEDGFLWCEHGSPSPYDQRATRENLEKILLPLE